MRGTSPEARARTRECMDVASEATTWLVLYVTNGSAFYAQFREQELGVAKEGLQRMHKALSLREDLANAEGPFLVGNSPTIEDCVLVALVQFAAGVCGIDVVGKHRKLKLIVETFEKRDTVGFPELPGVMTMTQVKNVMSVE